MTERTGIGYIEISKRDDFFEIRKQSTISQSSPTTSVRNASATAGSAGDQKVLPSSGGNGTTPGGQAAPGIAGQALPGIDGEPNGNPPIKKPKSEKGHGKVQEQEKVQKAQAQEEGPTPTTRRLG